MTKKDFNNIVNSILEKLDSKEDYADLCEETWDYDNSNLKYS